MTIALDHREFSAARADLAGWRRHALWLAAAWAAILLVFRADAGDLAGIYWNSTTFGHCLFVLPIVGWLVWQRRADLPAVPVAAWAPALAIVAGGAFVWFAGAVAGVALARHLGLVLMLQGAVVTLLGIQATRALLFPIAYLLFLVPFGEFLEAPLQDFTVTLMMPLLHVVRIPAQVDGVLITTPAGYFEVAEACSGAKFVIAMLAYGVLAANVCFVSWRRRLGFLGIAIVIPMLANVLRAWGTIVAAELTSVEAATGLDHIVYGWVFFALVMAMVLAAGWRWFDRDPDASWFDPTRLQSPVRGRIDAGLALAAILMIAGGAAGAAHAIAERHATLPARIDLPQVPGWTRVAVDTQAPFVPNYPGADHFVYGRYADDRGVRVDLAVALYGAQHEGKEMVGFGIGPIAENDRWIRIDDLPPLMGGAALRMTHAGPVNRETVTWNHIGAIVTGDPQRVKLETLRVKLLRGDQAGVAVVMSAVQAPGIDTRAAIRRFLVAAGGIETIADGVTGTAK
ncbi:exosortase A [Sphingomonas baiyangensis]|uniref:EpsI family protein n=1 Tax=Sphingomonas baiyangensis TaxID=2572576 RepID=A0A4U1L3Z8_9SPHN|nr:exosortase A [Sphingomonas baiyangensis]TKD50923.1 EpsI family protein [Sphingomonas baiyangensis]